MESAPAAGEYVFDNASDEATKQLRLLGEILDGHSTAVLADLQPQDGWRCWDVGAGAGTISTWLADRVGPRGSVLATDLKPQHVATRGNVQVREHDVRRDEPPGTFDLIHARLVLMHLPERDAVLRRLVDCLAPGGTLMVTDWDLTNPDYLIAAPTPDAEHAFRSFQAALLRVATMAEMDGTWAQRAAKAFRDVGLQDTRTTGEVTTWIGGSPGCLLHRSNSYQLEMPLRSAGMTDGDLASLRESMVDPEMAVWSFQVFTTTGRCG